MLFDTNKVVLSGKITKIDTIQTKQLKTAVNLLLVSQNKYSDVNPCQAYGELAELIKKNYPIGTNVIVIGRLRSVGKDPGKISNWVVIEKIAEELMPQGNEGGGDYESGGAQ